MLYNLVALLDRPSTKSFGILPILVHESDSDKYIVHGLAGGAIPLLLRRPMTVQEFVRQYCRDVISCNVAFSSKPTGKVSGWIGSHFLTECKRLTVPVPELPEDACTHKDDRDTEASGGHFWIGNTDEVYVKLELWLITAAKVACEKRNHDIATLMNWCLPNRVETHAASWYTAPDKECAQHKLKWLFQVWYKYHNPDWTEESLEDHLKKEAEKILASEIY